MVPGLQGAGAARAPLLVPSQQGLPATHQLEEAKGRCEAVSGRPAAPGVSAWDDALSPSPRCPSAWASSSLPPAPGLQALRACSPSPSPPLTFVQITPIHRSAPDVSQPPTCQPTEATSSRTRRLIRLTQLSLPKPRQKAPRSPCPWCSHPQAGGPMAGVQDFPSLPQGGKGNSNMKQTGPGVQTAGTEERIPPE